MDNTAHVVLEHCRGLYSQVLLHTGMFTQYVLNTAFGSGYFAVYNRTIQQKCPLAEFNFFSCFSELGALKYSLKIDSEHAECQGLLVVLVSVCLSVCLSVTSHSLSVSQCCRG